MPDRKPPNQPYTDDTIPMRVPPPQPARTPPRRARPQQPQVPPPNVRPPRRAVPPPNVRPPRQRASAGTWLKRIVLLVLALAIVGIIGLVIFQQRVADQIKIADVRQHRPPINTLVTPMNVLLLGVDLRPNAIDEGVRSDTIILLHLDPASGWASMLSIPRDSAANVPGFGELKINAAFARGYDNAAELYGAGTDPIAGGAALAADTVEQFLNLPAQNTRINYVATINFDGFAAMIDALGGIEIDVPSEIVDTEYPTEDFGTMTITIPAGVQRMDGTTALQYVRTRHGSSDFERAQRQQQVLRAITDKLQSQPLVIRPFSALRLIDAAGNAIKTTMPVGRPDALLMAAMLSRIDPGSIQQYRLSPETAGVEDVGFNLYWNPDDVQRLVREALSPPGEAKEAATIQVQNGVGVAGIAGRITTALTNERFTVVAPGDAEPVEQSVIIDYGDHPATRQRLSRVLGGMPVREGSTQDSPGTADIVVLLGSDYAEYWNDQ